MLDNEKKSLIETEEHYRHLIASKLGSIEQGAQTLEKSLWDKVSAVLNSNFGLWFLSSVFISGGATMYQITQHHYETELAQQKEVITCEFEIVNRLNGMGYLLRRANTVGEAQFALTSITKSLGPVSSEFEHVNIAVLYFKIYQLTGIRDIEMGNYVRELEEINLVIQGENPKAAFNGADKKRLLEIIDILQNYARKQIDNRKKQ